MLPNAVELIAAAIVNKRCLAIHYKDQRQLRVIEPHVLYRTKSNRGVVQSYQIRGHSSGGRVAPFWRPFQLKKITSIQMLDETFSPRIEEGYEKIRKLISGEIIGSVNTGNDEYFYYNPAIYGPVRSEGFGHVTRKLRTPG